MPDHYRVLILGGGAAGITVAAQLRRTNPNLDIGLVEPSESHFYQPLWTLVGAGVFSAEASRRREKDYIPRGVDWIRERVHEILPDEQAVTTGGGRRLTYDWLVVALGIQIDWTAIPGLAEGIGTQGICSNYSFQHVAYTWETIRSFAGGTALFTVPNTAVKCGGAPQKIMYLADDAFRRSGVRDRTQIIFASPQKAIFSVEKYRKTLEAVVARKNIDARFRQNLVELRPEAHVEDRRRRLHTGPSAGPQPVRRHAGGRG